jgi:hypothetical protein
MLFMGISTARGAESIWWSYLAQYDDGPGSIRLDLRMHASAPVPGFEYIVITGPKYKTTRKDGLPEEKELARVNGLAPQIISAVSSTTDALYVGTFTHSGEQLHYIYIKDPTHIKESLTRLYENQLHEAAPYINIRHDPDWSAYLGFLYPNEPTRQFYHSELVKLGVEK